MHLTPREVEVIQLLAEGLSTRQISQKLWISPATARNHIASINTILGTHSRLQAVAAWRKSFAVCPSCQGSGISDMQMRCTNLTKTPRGYLRCLQTQWHPGPCRVDPDGPWLSPEAVEEADRLLTTT